jgi:signal transduction histidine kinase
VTHDFQIRSRLRWLWSRLMLSCWVAACLAGALPSHAANDSPQSPSPPAGEEIHDPPFADLGSWIWADTTSENQVCLFWRAFDVPAGKTLRKARLRMTVDNEFILYLDGRELGRGAEWRELFDFDITPLLSPGPHTLAVSARNSFSFAGLLFGLRLQFTDGSLLEIKSDENWRVVSPEVRGWSQAPRPEPNWPVATIAGAFGSDPWWKAPLNVNVMPVLQPIQLRFWQTGWFQAVLLSVCGVVIGFSLWLMAQLALHKKERLLLERERARIARDIHDDLGSKMTQLVLHGEVLQSDLAPKSELRGQLDVICDDARRMLSTLDEILWAVNPRRDTLDDFSSYVCGYVEDALKHTTIECRFDVDSAVSGMALDMPVRRMLLMAIKETLNNAVKYSGATELLLGIKCVGRKLTVIVHDNGRGFDPKTVKSSRHGLKNMAQRMDELGGTCVVVSAPGQGCRVEFSLALKSSRQPVFAWLSKSKSESFPPVTAETETESAPADRSVPNQ